MRSIGDGDLVYGIQLPVQAQSEMFVAEWERTAGPDELVAMAKAADDAGFFYVAVCDHVAIPERLAPAMGITWYDTVATLAMLAGVTTRVRLLSHVWVAAYRHPSQTVSSFATLDRLSNGRAILGVGAGHVPEEFAHLGVDFHRRGAILDDRIDAIKLGLTQAVVGGMGIGPRPVQKPRIPIWVGGSAPASIRRAALKGDGWLPQGTPRDDMPTAVALLRDEREKAGIEEPCEIGAITAFCYVGSPDWDCGPTLSGPPEQIAEDLRGYRDIGVSHLQVRFRSRSCAEQCDQMAAFGQEVGPLLTP
jgi:probable F420-dependent oxidoreductase